MERRDHVPDVRLVAHQILGDLRNADESQGRLDAIGTMTGLTEDDLIEIVIELGRKIVAAE